MIELLVVMLVLGVLAAIAVPVYLGQRRHALDTAARSDAAHLGGQITAWYADHVVPPSVTVVAGHYLVDGADAGAISPGVLLGTPTSTPVATTALDTSAWTPNTWCVNVFHPEGSQVYAYSAASGLRAGPCS